MRENLLVQWINAARQRLFSYGLVYPINAVVWKGLFMITRFAFALCLATLGGAVLAQGPRPSNLGASKLDLGEPGIQWYTTWESAEAEAKRSGRAIMFVAAATQCHGVSGVF
jgi:hypothetical protein